MAAPAASADHSNTLAVGTLLLDAPLEAIRGAGASPREPNRISHNLASLSTLAMTSLLFWIRQQQHNHSKRLDPIESPEWGFEHFDCLSGVLRGMQLPWKCTICGLSWR
ncbi:MAG: hypothetical protein AB7D07_10465 [Desulfovibrionaceae bacterium]|jgi:hypothetical protein